MTQKIDGAKSTIARLEEALRSRRRRDQLTQRKQQADQLVSEAVKGLPAKAQARIRTLCESTVRRFVEADEPAPGVLPTGSGLAAGDPPTIEIPPDVAELPAEAQATWLQSYMSNIAKGEDKALHIAWAEVYTSGWAQTDQGWKKEQAGAGAGGDPLAAPAPDMALTAESLKTAIAKVVADERAYLSESTGAGRITNMGGGDPDGAPPAEQTEATLKEAFAGLLGDAKQAEVAAQGRWLG